MEAMNYLSGLLGGGSSNPEYTPEELEMLRRQKSGGPGPGSPTMNNGWGYSGEVPNTQGLLADNYDSGGTSPEGSTWWERMTQSEEGEGANPYATAPAAPALSQEDSLGPLLALLNQRKGQSQARAPYKPEFGGYLGSLLGG